MVKVVKVPKGRSFRTWLINNLACLEAKEWVGRRSLRCAWRKCEYGDWMLWLAAKANVDRRVLVFAACQCARLSLHHVPKDERRPLRAIETAEAWCQKKATSKKAQKAACSTWISEENSTPSAEAATNSAYLCCGLVYAHDTKHCASNTAEEAAAASHLAFHGKLLNCWYRPEYLATLRQCADIARTHIPLELVEQGVEESWQR